MADDDAKKDDNKAGGKPDDRDRRPRWPILAAIVVLAIFIVVVLAIIFIPTSRVWTDDAYVQVHYASIAPRISGQISAIGVDDNDVVPAGRELVQLDDRDQLAAVHLAEAQLARDTAQLADRLANVDRQPSIIAQQDSQIAAIKARMIIATANQRRYATLAATGAGSQQDRQQADSQLAELQAELDG
ncbi:biotin/lipoyl-binding protein, partial [Endobacter medicaginis]